MKQYFRFLALALLLGFLLPRLSRGEVGNDNPMGPTGEYNGSITTGGSYDPYTGNAKRFIDDLTVTGSVGAYPLKWTRVLNTRNPSPWSHSYNWGLWVRPYAPYHYYDPPYEGPGAVVNYPDGRTLNFAVAEQPYTYFQDPSIAEPQDRLVHMGGGNFDLWMRDGGKVRFQHPAGSTSGYDLVATQIIDPYGQPTLLTRDGAGRLSQITEPGGRYLQINYNSDGISSVQAFSAPGQLTETVSYTYTTGYTGSYSYRAMTRADYDDGTYATYTYGASNTCEIPAGLIQTCDDVRFAGPMKKIEYEYMLPGGPYEVSYGQIKREKNATTHQIVSEVTYPTYNPRALGRMLTFSAPRRGVTARPASSNTPVTVTGN
ncbi:MAG: hypothetical protein DLM73_01685 [Chthoniobacterales bacterium]|nr:MAG: hypothetical protein DLM73_01685 [Chthoniobacterales bacterium]